ncbi:MAG: sigma-54 dependent transcriptional regulator [Candidatus Sumerlaeia bacterium]|nr:sigma-54 dependent transcriptional regulator [Candidatus Sumerlaeia bacterium]
MATVLILDDQESILKTLTHFLERQGFQTHCFHAMEPFEDQLRVLRPDCVMVDMNLPTTIPQDEPAGAILIRRIRRDFPALGMIAFSSDDTPRMRELARREGADLFLSKPIVSGELLDALRKLVKPQASTPAPLVSLDARLQPVPEPVISSKSNSFPEIITRSANMVPVLKLLEKVSPRDLSVLLWGESGTGKELFAQAIHRHSSRRTGQFVPLNCAALPANLVESELFGHEKGAFTGAIASHTGKILQASGGTLFLDEIGELPLEIQPKLLRALQEKTFIPVGGKSPIQSDFRLVCATNRDLVQEVKAGRFREDLFYRIAVFPIKLPPLRERKEDLEVLLRHFLKMESPTPLEPSPEAIQFLQHHGWPGNIRELRNFAQAIPLFCDGNVIDRNALEYYMKSQMEGSGFSFIRSRDAASTLGTEPVPASPSGARIIEYGRPVRQLEELEREEIEYALKYYQNNVSEAARALGMGRATLYKYIKKHGLIVGLEA